jgi:hypothetical protein
MKSIKKKIINKWSKEELAILNKYYGKKSLVFISEQLTRHSYVSLLRKLYQLGLKEPSWTPDKIQKLKNLYPRASWDVLFEEFKPYKQMTICQMANLIGVKRKTYYYTKDEVKYLKSNYKKLNSSQLATNLNRSKISVASKLRRLRVNKQRYWTTREKNKIKKLYLEKTYAEIAEILDRSVYSVNKMALNLKLKKRASNSVKNTNK